jgi:hypothetical protein
MWIPRGPHASALGAGGWRGLEAAAGDTRSTFRGARGAATEELRTAAAEVAQATRAAQSAATEEAGAAAARAGEAIGKARAQQGLDPSVGPTGHSLPLSPPEPRRVIVPPNGTAPLGR